MSANTCEIVSNMFSRTILFASSLWLTLRWCNPNCKFCPVGGRGKPGAAQPTTAVIGFTAGGSAAEFRDEVGARGGATEPWSHQHSNSETFVLQATKRLVSGGRPAPHVFLLFFLTEPGYTLSPALFC